jgi:hypothetical protein
VTLDGNAAGLRTAQPIDDGAMAVLRRITRPRNQAEDIERCEMCGEDIAAEHSHVASLSERRLLCSCRSCYLLFTQEGAGARRLRAVPERYRTMPGFSITEEQWGLLSIPVDLVFFFAQSEPPSAESVGAELVDAETAEPMQNTVACYPSPAGATESLLDLQLWQEIVGAHIAATQLEPDVEALLVRRHATAGTAEADRIECFLVPIDACYELVGIVRQYWVGFAGGPEVWRHIDGFFARVADRARPA